MGFLDRHEEPLPKASGTTARQRGLQAEARALALLQAAGLQLLERNYRVPRRGGGEIDLILRDAQGCVIFVEVRSRSRARWGGAGASISAAKRARITAAAQHYLMRWRHWPACRFDVVLFDGSACEWIPGAFDAA